MHATHFGVPFNSGFDRTSWFVASLHNYYIAVLVNRKNNYKKYTYL